MVTFKRGDQGRILCGTAEDAARELPSPPLEDANPLRIEERVPLVALVKVSPVPIVLR
jgi:hypothetical protein